jgi:hypothetical protein
MTFELERYIGFAFVLVTVVVLAAGAAVIQLIQDRWELSRLPAEVVAAVEAELPRAEFRWARREVRDGQIAYEIGTCVDEDLLTIVVAPDGQVMKIVRPIGLHEFPRPVREELLARYPRRPIRETAAVTDGRGSVHYEVRFAGIPNPVVIGTGG